VADWYETDDRIGLVNDDGEWSLWRTFAHIAAGRRHVGPGYIAHYKHRSGRVLVDDTVHSVRTLNNPVSGGLGAFGMAVAQRNEWFPREPYNYCWDITERMDGRAGAPRPHVQGFGVLGFDITSGPRRVGDRGERVALACRTRLGAHGVHLVTVLRDYELRNSSLRCRTRVRVEAAFAGWFAKEPKLVAHSIGPPIAEKPYTHVEVFDALGNTLLQRDLRTLPDPTVKTLQIGHDGRWRCRFRVEDEAWDLNVVAEAAGLEAWDAEYWEGANGGLDLWAVRSNGREPLELCEADEAYCLQGLGRTLTRQWECARWTDGARPQVGVMLHGWEGGSGYPDCRCTYRAGVPGEAYEVRTRYSLGPGWV
jgi:hypothetical protein